MQKYMNSVEFTEYVERMDAVAKRCGMTKQEGLLYWVNVGVLKYFTSNLQNAAVFYDMMSSTMSDAVSLYTLIPGESYLGEVILQTEETALLTV